METGRSVDESLPSARAPCARHGVCISRTSTGSRLVLESLVQVLLILNLAHEGRGDHNHRSLKRASFVKTCSCAEVTSPVRELCLEIKRPLCSG